VPTIFEVFGYPLTDRSKAAEDSRKSVHCPFMGADCDGGGNRYLSHVDTQKDTQLRSYFGDIGMIPSGVCSIQVQAGESPWIVCPRRLLSLGHQTDASRLNQGTTQTTP